MRELVDFLFDKFSEEYHYKTIDIGDKFSRIDVNFNELIPNNGENLSKEILDDMLIYTHRDENNKVYIYCTTVRNTEAFFVLKRPPKDLKLISNHGVFIYEEEERIEGDKKIMIPYISHCVLFTKDIKEEGREIIGFTPKVKDRNVVDIFLIDKDTFVVTTTKGEILKINKESEILSDIKAMVDNLVEWDEEKEIINYEIYSSNCILVKVLKKGVSSVMEDNLVKSYIINVSKEYVMNEFDSNVYINRIFNSHANEYFDKGYIWLTRNEGELSPEDKEILAGEDMMKMEEVMNKYQSNFISYLCPLVKTTEDNWVQINHSINDIGGIIDGLNLFYMVWKKEDTLMMRIYSCRDNKIIAEDVPVPFIPHKIEANERTGVVNFKFLTDQSMQSVTYFLEFDEVEKYSYTMIKVPRRDLYIPVIDSLKERIYYLNNKSERLSQEELGYLRAAYESTVWDESVDKVPEIASAFWCNVSEEDVYAHAEKLLFGSEARFITKKNLDSSISMLMRLRIKESLEVLREKEEKYQQEEINLVSKVN